MLQSVKHWGRALAVSVSLAAMPAAVQAESLADALANAYNTSGLIDQNRALLRAADEDVAIAVSRLRPIIEWTSSFTGATVETRGNTTGGNLVGSEMYNANLEITASMMIYDFGRSQLGIKAAKETVLATRQGLISIEQQVLMRAVEAYLNMISATEVVSLRNNNLSLLREELRAAQDRFDVGEVTRTDVALAQARVAAAESGLAEAEGNRTQALEEYRAVTGQAPGSLSSPSVLPNLPTVDAAKQVALRNHPELRRAQYAVAAAETNIDIAESATRPTISLFGGASVEEQVNGSDYSTQGRLGVQASGPIYQGGMLNAQRRKVIAQRDAQLGNLHVVKSQVVQNVGNAYAVLRAARASREAGREQVRAATVAFEGVREEARLGSRTTLDVLDAEQELLDARAGLIDAETFVDIASYSVLSAMGQLTAKDLSLNVRTYNPAIYYNLAKDAPVRISPQGQKLDKVLRAIGKE